MVKSGMEERPRSLPKTPEVEECPKKNELVEELMARIDVLETELRAKDGALYKTKKDLDRKSGVENTLLEKEKALKSIEVSMPRMVEEHKKLLTKKDEQIAALKTAKDGLESELKSSKKNLGHDQDEQKASLKEASQQIMELKSKIQEIKLIKDDEVKSVKAELKNLAKLKDGDIKSLKAELKKAGGDKEVEIRDLKDEIVKVKDQASKVFMEEKKSELKTKDKDLAKKLLAKEEELNKKLLAKEEDLKVKMKSVTDETKNKLDKKESEINERITVKDQEMKKALEVKDKEYNIRVTEFKSKLDMKDEQVLRANAELTAMEGEIKVLKLAEAGRADLEEKLATAESKAEQGRREVLDLKSYQRKLEGRVGEMEEEVFMVRAELQTQGHVRAGLVAKIQDREERLGLKKEEFEELGKVNQENLKNAQSLKTEKEAALAESESLKKELSDMRLALENMEVELEAARMNLTSPLSSQYAVNTPRRRRSNPHRLDLSGRLEGEDIVEVERETNPGEEEGINTTRQEEGARSHTGPGKRPLPFSTEGEPAKKPRLGQEDMEEEVKKTGISQGGIEEEVKKAKLSQEDVEDEVKKPIINQGDLEEEEVAQLLTIDTVDEESQESEMSDEDIAKLLDKAEDVGSKGQELENVVLAVLEDVIGEVIKEVVEKEVSEQAVVHQEILEMLMKCI